MQTLAGEASRWLAWEQIDLPCGVFRVQNARWLYAEPDLTGWVNWSGTSQLNEEIRIALEILGEEMTGTWAGMGNTVAGICHGIAWMVS